MMTKKEIKKEIRDIKTLEKAMGIVICDDDLRNGLILKMANKMTKLIETILEERELTQMASKDFRNSLKDIESHITSENEIYPEEHFQLNAIILGIIIEIEVMVLDKH